MFAIGGLCLLLWLAVVNASNSSEVQVGSGNYTLKDKNVTLIDEFKIYGLDGIVPEHLYPGCSIQINNDTIILKYNETSKEVCTVGLLTKRDDIEFTTSLKLCNDKNKKEDLKGHNILPFAYSLTNKEVNEIKNGPLYGKNAVCPDEEAFGEIAGYVTRFPIENLKKEVYFTVKIDTKGGVDSGGLVIDGISNNTTNQQDPRFQCIDPGLIIKPKAWKIDGNVKEEIKTKKLMTFHLLPRSASRARDEYGTLFTGKLPDFTPNHCRNMSINRTDYELLEKTSKVVEANSSTTTTTAQPSTNSTATNETISQEPTDSTAPNPTNETETMAANKSSEVPPKISSSPPTPPKVSSTKPSADPNPSKKASNEDESSEGSGGTTEELLSMEAKNMSGTQLETQGSHVSEKKSVVVDKKEVGLSKKEEISKKEVSKENMKKTLSKDVVGGGGGVVVPNTIESKELTGEQTTEEEVAVKPPPTPKAIDPQVSTFSAPYEVDRKRLIVPMKEKGDPSTESKKSIESIVSAEKKESKPELTVSSDEVVGNKEEGGDNNNKKKEESDDKKEEEVDDNNKKEEGGDGDNNKEADVYD
uniref:Uncharacterized protein n=1 Tax=Meloidogyne javanica TaxID=6303 RepID=A0A915MBB3_MELJA